MKKLLFTSLLGLSALYASAQVPVVTAPSGWCDGTYLVVNGSWYKPTKSTPAPAYYSWDLILSDQWGGNFGNVFSTGVVTATGGQPNGPYTFPNTWTYTTAGNYYLVQLGVSPDGISWNYTTALVYYSPYPQPVITGSTTTCGSTQGYFCASNLVNTEYVQQWGYFNSGCGCTQSLGNNWCVNTPANYAGGLSLTVNNAYGCQSSTSVTVNNYVMDADFTVTCSPAGAGYYTATASRISALPQISGYAESWHVEEVSGANPYPAITGTGMYNTAWDVAWWAANTNPAVNFSGYDGTANGSYNNQTYNITTPASKFVNGTMYRITRIVTSPYCAADTMSKVIYTSGVWCSNCRTGQDTPETGSAISFNVYPNPTSGQFQVTLGAAAGNAQAELFNLLGERVDAFTITGTSYSYSPAQTLAPGVYLLRITNNGNVSSQRIVVE